MLRILWNKENRKTQYHRPDKQRKFHQKSFIKASKRKKGKTFQSKDKRSALSPAKVGFFNNGKRKLAVGR